MTPTLKRSVPFFPYAQVFTNEEADLVRIFTDVGRRGAFILQDDLAAFETHLALYTGAAHAVGVANATDGLHLALRACGIGPGDEVIFASHTMVASAAAIKFAGAIPVPVECGRDHLIDPQGVAAAVTPRTRAILPTQLNGRTADMDALGSMANKNGLTIVEDAAQALGSRYKGRFAGTFGAAAAISFFPAKLLGCLGDGGAVLTSDRQIYERLLRLHDHGRGFSGDIEDWGLNSRLDNLQAAILDWRLARLNQAIDRRREIARRYERNLQAVPEIDRPPSPDIDANHFDVFQNYEIEADDRDGLRAFLKSRGVGTLLPWGGKAVHQWPELGFKVSLPFTEKLFERVLLLPMNPFLSDDEVDYVSAQVAAYYV